MTPEQSISTIYEALSQQGTLPAWAMARLVREIQGLYWAGLPPPIPCILRLEPPGDSKTSDAHEVELSWPGVMTVRYTAAPRITGYRFGSSVFRTLVDLVSEVQRQLDMLTAPLTPTDGEASEDFDPYDPFD